jgi:hypothetical protein
MGGEFWGFAAGRDAFVPPDAESDGSRQTALHNMTAGQPENSAQQHCEQIDV